MEYTINIIMNDNKTATYTVEKRVRDIAGRGYDNTVIGTINNSEEAYKSIKKLYDLAANNNRLTQIKNEVESAEKKISNLYKEYSNIRSALLSQGIDVPDDLKIFHHPV